jgi:integrase
MGCIYRRGTRLWIRFKGPDGKWTQRKTSHFAGNEPKARKLLFEVEAKIAAGAEFAEAGSGPITVARYAEKWISDRESLGLADWGGDAARLKNHVLPTIGKLRLDEVRPRHLVEMVRNLRRSSRLAPKTIYNIYSTLKALFRDAKIDDLLTGDLPTILTKYQLGENVDKDPEWRGTARYTRDELEILISDARIPIDRRVFYALEGIGGLRLGEVAGLRFRHHDAGLSPLGGILVATSYNTGRTKTKQPRRMPVHPTLAAILAEWRLSGWAEMMGRKPTPDDLIAPMPPDHAARRREGRTLEGMRSRTYCFKRFRDDLKMLGFRHRRGHDLRRTMISLSREDGARKDLLELCTHNPTKKGSSIDVYTTFPWEAFCGEVQKLVVRRRDSDNVVDIRATATAGAAPVGGDSLGTEVGGGLENPMISRDLATSFATSAADPKGIRGVSSWRRRESNPGPEALRSSHYVRVRRFGFRRRGSPPAGRPDAYPSSCRDHARRRCTAT